MPRRCLLFGRSRSRSRSRSVSKSTRECRTKCTTKNVYKSKKSCYSSESDTDCSCGGCDDYDDFDDCDDACCQVVVRGRSPHREICFLDDGRGRKHWSVSPCNSIRRRRSRSRTPICLRDSSGDEDWEVDIRVAAAARPRNHRQDDCRCNICDANDYNYAPRYIDRRNHYRVVENDDGRMDMYRVERVYENVMKQHEEEKKKKEEAKEAAEKKRIEALDLLSRVCGNQGSSHSYVPALPFGHASPLSAWGSRDGDRVYRSAEQIRREKEQCETDLKQVRDGLKQLHERAASKALKDASKHQRETLPYVNMEASCSGALRDDPRGRNGNRRPDERHPKPILVRDRVHF